MYSLVISAQTTSRIVDIQPSTAALTVPKTPQFAKAKSRLDDTREDADQVRGAVDEAREQAPGALQGLRVNYVVCGRVVSHVLRRA